MAENIKLISNVKVISNIDDCRVDKIVNRLYFLKKFTRVINYLTTYSEIVFNFL